MTTQSPSSRSALRAFVVLALSIFVLVVLGADLRRLWYPLGELGFATDGDGIVIGIDADSPGAKAGIQIGDAINLSATPPQSRWYVTGNTWVWAPGQRHTFGLVRSGVRHTMTLTAVAQTQQDSLRKAMIVIKFIASALFVFVGATLVLVRPSLMTWGFFFYCLAFVPGSWEVADVVFPYPGPYIVYGISDVIDVAGLTGLLIFSLCFLADAGRGWRSIVLRLTPVIFIALLISWFWDEYQISWAGGPPGELLTRVTIATMALVFSAALYAFVDTYIRDRGTDRQRMRWVVVGFGISLGTSFLGTLLSYYSPNTPYWVIDVLNLCSVCVPLTFAYAVIKHRVIDVSFVVSRALVYTTLTSVLVGVFSLIDWFFTDYLQLSRLGTLAEVGTVVAFGFWFNDLHRRVDSLIDATFFRQRHRAEAQLARVAGALPLVTTAGDVGRFLVDEPMQALSLASAALFRRNTDGVYVREVSEGWNAGSLRQLDQDDGRLLALVLAENGPLSLYDHHWRSAHIPSGPARPALALPIIVRRELAAIALYGSHEHGEALDPDEIRAIGKLGPAAAAAYDHLDAESMRHEIAAMRSELARLRSTIAEFQIQPT